jgi:hypothetical protein
VEVRGVFKHTYKRGRGSNDNNLPRTTDGHAIETGSIGPAPEEADVWSLKEVVREDV